MFQFHKVRLKAYASGNASLTFLFQFHKVRLKDPDSFQARWLHMFQFHKVRLKEGCRLEWDDHETSFNSIRYD